MTSKERMLVAMWNRQPDMVPVAPDISNMVPCRLTGLPFWDIYLYRKIPLWKAYTDAVRYFGFDGWLTCDTDLFAAFCEPRDDGPATETVIVEQDEERIITRSYSKEYDRLQWSDFVTIYPKADPPMGVRAETVDLMAPPQAWRPIEGVNEQKKDEALLAEVMEYMGDDGIVGLCVPAPVLGRPGLDRYSIYDYVDRHEEVAAWAELEHERSVKKLDRILSAGVRPDFILTGSSGMLIFNTPDIVREIALPTLKEVSRMCKRAGMPTQIHCCGPEKELIRMVAEETDVNNMNPLEIPPMGDCRLAEIKKQYGSKVSLMGNLHTTDVMLRGTAEEVTAACRQAIQDAGDGGGFILSTGDQCGRDTPDGNIAAMVEAGRTYGKY